MHYLSQTEVHVFALSIAASVLLSFFPFLIVMVALVRQVFRIPLAESALTIAIKDYFPGTLGTYIADKVTHLPSGRLQLLSIILLLFTANGIFEPLEVALNRAWGVARNRSYFKNQLLSLFLILLCGGIALGSVLLTAVNQEYVAAQFGIHGAFPSWLSLALFKIAAIPATILSLFLTYWLLPNCRVPVRRVLPVAVTVGILLELAKYLFVFAWPWLNKKLAHEYGPFQYSVSIVIFSGLTSLLVLAGAEWSARDSGPRITSAESLGPAGPV